MVVGAGPAGSLAAYKLAERGASVLLVDRARFPRDKPCGGGLTVRAVRLLPFSLAPVTEDVIRRLELRLHYGKRFERVRPNPIAIMTQRTRLDAFLAERATAVGAVFRDGVRVRGIEADDRGVTVDAGGQRSRGAALIGADGANGIAARALGLCARPAYGVALEGNLPRKELREDRYRGSILFELGVVRSGYGWIFPKEDHVNVGVGGWEREGPTLRSKLARLCREHGVSERQLQGVRGHRLPVRRPDALLARGPALVVGDAAGLIDPFSGDGIYEAFLSATLAAEATADLLAGRAPDLVPYDVAVRRTLQRLVATAWAAKMALEQAPSVMFTLARSELVQGWLEGLARGDPAPGSAFRWFPLEVLGRVARVVGERAHAVATHRVS
ncbi:MAG: geranylgeranyl reductase family protein [Actinomycetota bacterium]|nr:geranylgeranyl reductase family protein [Actinomycetota bacterium]